MSDLEPYDDTAPSFDDIDALCDWARELEPGIVEIESWLSEDNTRPGRIRVDADEAQFPWKECRWRLDGLMVVTDETNLTWTNVTGAPSRWLWEIDGMFGGYGPLGGPQRVHRGIFTLHGPMRVSFSGVITHFL